MFKSIRWKLILSYVLLTLVTVVILGAIAYSFVNEYVKNQENRFLTANAEAIATQASGFIRPIYRPYELAELVETSSILGNFRVIILNPQREIIADSGRPSGVDRFIWVHMPEGELEDHFEEISPFLLPILQGVDPSQRVEAVLPLIEGVFDNLEFRMIERIRMPFGSRVYFDSTAGQGQVPVADRSTRSLQVPIGELANPYGYVILQEGPNFGSETLETASKGFVIAAGGALLLSGLLGLFVARRLASPITQLTDAAGKMGAGDLSSRAPTFGRDEIGNLAKQFNRMASRLEDSFTNLAEERDTLRRFITDASHELRTPITALKNFNELLQGTAKNDRTARDQFLAESASQLDRLEWITQNLLNLSRLESGITQPDMEIFNANYAVKSVIAAHMAQAEERGVELINTTPGSDFELVSDRMLLQLALSNLVDNAIKFTPEKGQVKLGVSDREKFLRFWVRDNGVGIDPEDLPHIFDRFYRGRNAEADGSGLGLAMVEIVANALGGRIEVESELGAGSHFVLELPISDQC